MAENKRRRVDTLMEEVHGVLKEEADNLKQQREQLDRDRDAFVEEKAAMAVVGAKDGDIIEINVGGRMFSTKRATLIQAKDSILAGMFSGRWENSHDRDRQGNLFLDLDPDCFAVVLLHLRTQLLKGGEVCWEHVCAPTGKQQYFGAMLAFLGLLTTSEFIGSFGFFSGMIATNDGKRCVKSQLTSQRQWAISSEVLRDNACKWGMKINRFAGDWIFLGVIGTTSPGEDFLKDGTAYGWGGTVGQVWIGGTNFRHNQGWKSFETGDRMVFELNIATSLLTMRLQRLPEQSFSIQCKTGGSVHIFVSFYSCAGDEVELCEPL